jgi:hypothetical protein
MRLFLLPISTRRTLIYCERVPPSFPPGQKPPITERIISRASQEWAKWERAEKGWQKQLTIQGNRLFKRIPYEEWGLKSIPPMTQKRQKEVDEGKVGFELLYPGRFLRGRDEVRQGKGEGLVKSVLQALATERQALHRKRMWTCIFWLPATIPFTVVPV